MRAYVFVLLVLTAACGRTHEDDDTALEDDETARDLVAAQCRYLERCQPRALEVFPGGTVEACTTEAPCVWPGFDVDDFGVRDPAACSAWLEQASCGEELQKGGASVGAAPVLGHPFVLALPEDSPCRPARFDRLAAAGSALGERCIQMEFACNDGLACVLDDPLTQVGNDFCGTCERLVAAGQRCTDRVPCEWGARCIEGTCQEPLPRGESCTSDEMCEDYLCVDGRCDLRSPPARFDGELAGTDCEDQDLNSCGNDVTLACIAGRCAPLADEGKACEDSGDCRAFLSCREQRCERYGCGLPRGEPCVEAICAADLWCDPSTRRCEEFPGEGDRCTFLCGPNLSCWPDGRCRPGLPDGSGCEEDGACESGICQRDLRPFCSPDGGCSIPPCDTPDCGTCVERPGDDACD